MFKKIGLSLLVAGMVAQTVAANNWVRNIRDGLQVVTAAAAAVYAGKRVYDWYVSKTRIADVYTQAANIMVDHQNRERAERDMPVSHRIGRFVTTTAVHSFFDRNLTDEQRAKRAQDRVSLQEAERNAHNAAVADANVVGGMTPEEVQNRIYQSGRGYGALAGLAAGGAVAYLWHALTGAQGITAQGIRLGNR